MKQPIHRTLLLLCSISVAAGAHAQGSASVGATADVTATALPSADVPAARLVTPPPAEGQEPSVREVVALDESTPDEPAIAQEIEQESAEMEDLRKAEEASKVQDASGAAIF